MHRRLHGTLACVLALACLVPLGSCVSFSAPGVSFPSLGSLPKGTYQHVAALFTQDPETYNVTAPLWYSSTAPTFCNPSPDSSIAGKIVLALRDTACDFLTRARNAASQQAAGLIIMDNKLSYDFDTYWMGPAPEEQGDPPEVTIPVVLITGQVAGFVLPDDRQWQTTTASITAEGLYMDDEAYWSSIGSLNSWDRRLRVAFNLAPFLMVILCYYAFWKTWRPVSAARAASPPAAAPPAAAAAPAAGAPAPAPVQAVPASGGVEVDGFRPLPPSQQHRYAEGEQLSLPVPPHLSSGSEGMTDVALEMQSPRRAGQDDHEHKENEHDGLMSSGAGNSGRAMGSAPHALRAENNAQLLNRPLLPAPSVAPSMKLYYRLLKSLSAAGKPRSILMLNAIVYAVHTVVAIGVIIRGWNEKCTNENLAMVSLWCARAMIGFRICYWQCQSNSAVPTCADIFFKNWADCIFLFTGSMFTWNEQQKDDCQMNAPTIYKAVQCWTILIYITYGLRLLFYVLDKYSQRHSASLPHVFTITARSALSIVNGGFSCAGALDKNQPATQLDLMLIPTVTYREGMYSQDDAVCGVCLGEYAAGETLRLLNCSHHFHSSCVDTWLLQKNTCPTCRTPIDAERVVRRNAQGGIVDVEDDEVRQEGSVNARPPSPSRVGQAGAPHDDERIPPHSYFNAQQVRRNDVDPL